MTDGDLEKRLSPSVQLGLSMADTELLSIGLVDDLYTEQVNDGYWYCELGTQEDMDRF